MNKITKILSTVTLCGAVGFAAVIASNSASIVDTDATGEMYSIVFSGTKNKLDATVNWSAAYYNFTSEAGTEMTIGVGKSQDAPTNDNWRTFEYTSGGQSEVTNLTKINGLSKLTVKTTALTYPSALTIKAGNSSSNKTKIGEVNPDANGTYTYVFDGSMSYFSMVHDIDNVNFLITELIIEYTCVA